jgi:hypothetical protein
MKWKFIKKRLGYNDEQMKTFRENPRNDLKDKMSSLGGDILLWFDIDGY